MEHDLRQGLTQRVVQHLNQRRDVLVVGGPKMGKSYLAGRAKALVSTVEIYEDCEPAQVPERLGSALPTLITAPVEHYEALRPLRPKVVWVPLTNVIPRTYGPCFERPAEAWAQTIGHPLLAARFQAQGGGVSGTGHHGLLDSETTERYGALLDLWAQDVWALHALLALPHDHTPAQRYMALHEIRREGLKGVLDRWVCAGILSRMVDGERPGLWFLPHMVRAAMTHTTSTTP